MAYSIKLTIFQTSGTLIYCDTLVVIFIHAATLISITTLYIIVTEDEVKNYKSITAHKYFIDGWVLDTCWKGYGDMFLLAGKVKHSYTSSKLPLQPWVGIRMNGSVEYGHCTMSCMAGLAETCSHVAAILYWLETAVRIKSNIPPVHLVGFLHLYQKLAHKSHMSP